MVTQINTQDLFVIDEDLLSQFAAHAALTTRSAGVRPEHVGGLVRKAVDARAVTSTPGEVAHQVTFSATGDTTGSSEWITGGLYVDPWENTTIKVYIEWTPIAAANAAGDTAVAIATAVRTAVRAYNRSVVDLQRILVVLGRGGTKKYGSASPLVDGTSR